MIEIPLLDELREIRRRLSEEQGNDPVRYAAMLRKVAEEFSGTYVDQPRRAGSARVSRRPKRKTLHVPSGKR
jgi:hypothetical protein